MSTPTSRRLFLRSTAGLAAAAGTGLLLAGPGALASAAATAAPPAGSTGTAPAPRRRPTSPNGWPIDERPNGAGAVWTRPVPGTDFRLDLAIGEAEMILVHVVRRFHYEIDALRPGDVVGFKAPGTVRGHEVNHASGTAVDIRPGHYPPGTRGGFWPQELVVLRDILAECDGVVRWGGDWRTPDESHFQIDVGPGDPAVRTLVDRLRGWGDTAGRGAGAVPDVGESRRRAAADRLARRQAG